MTAFKRFGVMIDCSRNAVINYETFKKIVDILSDLGYNSIRLYMEDTYEISEEPYFGYLRGRYSKKELKEMDEYAFNKGIELIPCIQTLAHLDTIFRYVPYSTINDCTDILLVGDKKTYELIDKMFSNLSECFRTRNIHIGMDEAYLVGRGQYIDNNEYTPKADVIRKHLDVVLELAKKYDLKCEIWGDMFFKSAYGELYSKTIDNSNYIKSIIPKNLKICYWDYYHLEKEHYENMIDCYNNITDNLTVAGGAWTWLGFCPNNSYSMSATKSAMKACIKKNVDEFYLTMWGDNGGECSPLAVLPTLFMASEYQKLNFDMKKIKSLFKNKYNISFDNFMLLDNPNNVFEKEELPRINTVCKTMLYGDPFYGMFDKRVTLGVSKDYYHDLSKKLKRMENNKDFGYMFKYIRSLCDVLEYKVDLSLKTRTAYNNQDKNALGQIIKEDYPIILKRIDKFINTLEEYWMINNKAFGFEVQLIRLGGLKQRLLYCRTHLEDYINGKIDRIEELEVELLEPYGTGGDQISFNNYQQTVSANHL